MYVCDGFVRCQFCITKSQSSAFMLLHMMYFEHMWKWDLGPLIHCMWHVAGVYFAVAQRHTNVL
jgi:hypothetical protein